MTIGGTASAEFKAILDQRRAEKQPVDWLAMGPLLTGIVDRLAEESRLHEAESKLPLAKAPAATQPKAKRANPAGRNPLFDALALACGANPAEATSAYRKTCGVALADILSVSPSVTEEDFRVRGDAFRRKHKDWPLTPMTLAKYWSELGPANGLTWTARTELAPDGWEDALRSFYDPSTATYMIGLGWEKLGRAIQQSIRNKVSTQEQPT